MLGLRHARFPLLHTCFTLFISKIQIPKGWHGLQQRSVLGSERPRWFGFKQQLGKPTAGNEGFICMQYTSYTGWCCYSDLSAPGTIVCATSATQTAQSWSEEDERFTLPTPQKNGGGGGGGSQPHYHLPSPLFFFFFFFLPQLGWPPTYPAVPPIPFSCLWLTPVCDSSGCH